MDEAVTQLLAKLERREQGKKPKKKTFHPLVILVANDHDGSWPFLLFLVWSGPRDLSHFEPAPCAERPVLFGLRRTSWIAGMRGSDDVGCFRFDVRSCISAAHF